MWRWYRPAAPGRCCEWWRDWPTGASWIGCSSAPDTPTGYGVTSLGILKTIGDICSLAGVAPATAWAVASGQAARAFGSDGNVIVPGAVADIVVMDTSLGSVCDTAVEAIGVGEFPGVAVVITDGVVRVRGSLCTLRSRRVADIEG